MKESILILTLLLLQSIATDGNRFTPRRKQFPRDKCQRMGERRRCFDAFSLWHYDIRASECKMSYEEECGGRGNRFRSKEDCERMCYGQSNIRARSYTNPGCHHKPCCQSTCCGHKTTPPPPPPPCCQPKPCCHSDKCCGSTDCCQSKSCCHSDKCCGSTDCCQSKCCSTPPPDCCKDKPCMPYPIYHSKELCSGVHCPTVCSSNRLSPELKSICCGCRTGTILRSECSSSDYCNHYCSYNGSDTIYNKCGCTCESTTARPTPPPALICLSDDPRSICKMECEHGFKKNSEGCPYCECEEKPVQVLCNPLICKDTCAFGCYSNSTDCRTYICLPGRRIPHRGVEGKELDHYCSDIRATCGLHCPHGYAKDRHGCDKCKCNQNGQLHTNCSLNPSCTVFCEHGFQRGPDGCEICLCRHSDSDTEKR